VSGSLQNVTAVLNGKKERGFMFSLLNPPVPLGGNIISLDIYVDDVPMQKKSVFIATQDDMVNSAALSDTRPLPFKPFQSARFLAINNGGLDEKRKHKIAIMSKMEGFEQVIIPFTFTDRIRRQGSTIFVHEHALESEPISPGENATIFKNFTTPLVLSGKKAYIVCSAHGGLSANWTWMGVRYDNGGLYVPPARAFGKIIVEVSMDDGVRKRLPNFVISSRHENGMLETRHEMGGLEVRRRLTVPFENRGFIMSLELALVQRQEGLMVRTKRSREIQKRKIHIHFLIDGNITSYGLAAVSQNTSAKFDARNNCLRVSTTGQKSVGVQYFGTVGVAPKSIRPSRVLADSYDNDMELSYDFELELGKPAVKLALVATGSFSSQASCLKEYCEMRDNYISLSEATTRGFADFSSSTLRIGSSSAPRHSTISKLIAAYEKTKTCLRYLKTEYDGLGEGICAGLPRFPNYWARDTGWTLRGYLAIGDYKFTASTIDNFIKRQARKTGNGAFKGELPMIISGKSFLHSTTYGSADSTFLFPWAILHYLRATGDTAYLEKRWNAIVDLIEYGFLKDLDGDGLLENDFTGVAEKLPIQDSTWMDHIDRRKSANDIQALFYESLMVGGELAVLAGDNEKARKWKDKASALQEKIDSEYWNPETGYYYDTIRKDGSKDPKIRPNALVLLLADVVKDRNKAESVLNRIEQPDMTTGWGLRTLSAQDPRYHPALYHDGAVWPLVTGWAALSELKYGRREQALHYLESMADRILAENGMFAETYRGDRPEPFNSCILQAWSAGMYAFAFCEMMLGMKLDMINNTVRIEPMIPDSLKDGASAPIDFERQLRTAKGATTLRTSIDFHNGKIMASIRGKNRPDISSGSYSVVVSTV
jgi:hypothetical protein